MASTIRLPAGTSARIVPSGSFVQCRAFSETSQQWRGRQMNFRPPSQVQPAFKTRTQGMRIADLPNDIGILPGTFVRPLWRDMPSIFKAPRDRWHMEWTWLKAWLSNHARLVILEFSDCSVRSGGYADQELLMLYTYKDVFPNYIPVCSNTASAKIPFLFS